ncbi:dephospho-CoA kinase [Actinoplanes sp. NPDC024001]|uniref:dephospho-CoA kinase n=1 Tax=Actinoplanes sp. NPDC024001 TaxID=3154598 RepID=UPI0033EF17A3
MGAGESWPSAAAQPVVAWARTRPPGTARRRVLAVEGHSGSGKTTLAAAVAGRLGAPLIHMDDLYAGWDGLTAGVTALHDWILAPLAEGRPASWRRWDWDAGEYAESHQVPEAGWLVVEGVGSGGRVLRPYLCGLIWLESPTAARKRRALARDGDMFAPHWDRWARQEAAFYAAERVRETADLIIENA